MHDPFLEQDSGNKLHIPAQFDVGPKSIYVAAMEPLLVGIITAIISLLIFLSILNLSSVSSMHSNKC